MAAHHPSGASPTLLQVSRRAADRLRSGHLWVYRSDLEAAPEEPAPGALVSLSDARGKPLGTALWSATSQIAARLVSPRPDLGRPEYLQELRERLRRAIHLRASLAPVDENNNAHRIVFSEADGLPGIIADRYNDLVVVQLLLPGTAQADVRTAISEVLAQKFGPGPHGITAWERADPRIQAIEQLNNPPAGPLFTTAGTEAHTRTEIRLNGVRFGYNADAGQKTGAFLDQRLNYAAAASWVERLLRARGKAGRVLDICTYQGGFALHLARVCEHVTGVDASRDALEAADRNFTLNPGLQGGQAGRVEWVEADAFDLLKTMEANLQGGSGKSQRVGRTRQVHGADALPSSLSGRFDAIVLDPPAFAKTRRAAEGALRGYKELNLRALRLLEPGGVLVTCSCSHHVGAEEFRDAVRAAAVDAGRSVQVLEARGAAPDHPELLALPETRYLKCLICRVD